MMKHQRIKSIKSIGSTKSERYLFRLCRSTFLQMWSHANLFRQPGQELCDVIIIFGSNILLFSDKEIKYPATGDDEVDWRRWAKKAIDASKIQLRGAAGWIRKTPERVFLDAACKQPFTFPIPNGDTLRIYKIAMATGAEQRCSVHYGEAGSLMQLNPVLWPEDVPSIPFTVPLQDPDGTIVHILDTVSLPYLLQELDTVADMVEYLNFKEDLIRNGHLAGYAGEEELLAHFLCFRQDFLKPDIPTESMAFLPSNYYSDLIKTKAYRNYIKENRIS